MDRRSNSFGLLELQKKNTKSDYVRPDFPNAEYYSYKTVYQEVPDEWLIKKLKDLINYEY
jgi:hypothetical protein